MMMLMMLMLMMATMMVTVHNDYVDGGDIPYAQNYNDNYHCSCYGEYYIYEPYDDDDNIL